MGANAYSSLVERLGFLSGRAVSLLGHLQAQGRIGLDAFYSRHPDRACLLGHLARTAQLRRDGWRVVCGVPSWNGRMGVAAASEYFQLDYPEALALFGSRRESSLGVGARLRRLRQLQPESRAAAA